MRIGFLIDSLAMGGAERATVSMANYMASKGEQVEIITVSDNNSAFPIDEKVKVIKPNIEELDSEMSAKRILGVIKKAFMLRKFVKSRNLDFLIGMSYIMTFYVVFSTKFTKTKSIGTERSNPYRLGASKLNGFFRKLFYRLVDGFIFQTKKASEFYTNELKSRDVIIPNAINNSLIYELSPPAKRQKIICAVGRLSQEKRIDILIDAFAKIADKIPGYVLIVFGDGPEMNNLQNQVERLKLAKRIILAGANLEAAKILNYASVYVLSSDFEGMPNALIEAIALGVPSVSTRCQMGPEEIIDNRVNGLLVETGNIDMLADAILEIINNPELAKKLSANAVKIKETNSIEAIGQRWIDFLKKI